MADEGQQASQYEDTPEGWANRWQMELKHAKEALEDFHKIGAEVDAVLRDEKRGTDANAPTKRLCLFQSGTKTQGAMMFGRMPQASVSRKFADADDDAARVAADVMERLLNCDIERTDDTFAEATRNNMSDLLGPGLGVQRHRYEMELEDVPEQPEIKDEQTGIVISPAVPATQRKAWERIDTDYVYWKDFLWGHCRTWSEVPWVAFLVKMSKEALHERFDEMLTPEVVDTIPLRAKHIGADDKDSEKKAHPWDRAEVWEIWHRDSKKVFWFVDGFDRTLDIKEDPMGLEGFFPCQRPMMANLTTSKLIPVPDYKFAQDLYKEVDILTTRIDLLAKATRVTGAVSKEDHATIQEMVKGGENKLYPVDNWAMFAEKGGVRGAIDWLPLDQIVAAMTALRDMRREDIDLIFQVTGQSDIQRGQQSANGTPGEAQVKAKFGSVRLQAMQDELARFASDGQRIRAEIISKHFDPQTIVKHSNIENTPDAQYAQQAIELIQSRFADYRIEIKPEAINLTDFAALKEERFEVLDGIAGYFQRMAPLMQAAPGMGPFFFQMLKVTVAGLRGGSAYEAIIDQAIAAAEQAAEKAAQQGPAPDPNIVKEQMKGQNEMQKIQAETQARLVEIQAETQAKAIQERVQRQENVAEAYQKASIPSVTVKPQPGPTSGTGRKP